MQELRSIFSQFYFCFNDLPSLAQNEKIWHLVEFGTENFSLNIEIGSVWFGF